MLALTLDLYHGAPLLHLVLALTLSVVPLYYRVLALTLDPYRGTPLLHLVLALTVVPLYCTEC